VKDTCTIRLSRSHFDALMAHLFPGDTDEHGAILLAGLTDRPDGPMLSVREIHLAREGIDYVPGKVGYRALTPQFIHKIITRARDERLAYLAVHNHHADRYVGFSRVDMKSHETGYPALLQIARGMPVGALVSGLHSLQADVWLANGQRLALKQAVVVGNTIERLYPAPVSDLSVPEETHERQVRMFGSQGQAQLALCRVAIVGLGGIGSLVGEYLARLGVGSFVLVDNDRVEQSNVSRIVGATLSDAAASVPKVDVAKRLILTGAPAAKVRCIDDDVAKESVAKVLTAWDYIFLAADSMRARLVVNAIVQQYLIPGVQMGSKIRANGDGDLIEVLSVNRPLRPGGGCLWCNQFIDPNQLALEAKTDQERLDQAYGVHEPNPSVISLNAVAAATAVNDFVLDFLGLRAERDAVVYQHYHHLDRRLAMVKPRMDSDCPECSLEGLRFGRGDSVALPCTQG